MNPDTAEGRINRLERQVAGLEAQVKDVRDDVRTFETVKERLTRIEEQVKQVRAGLLDLQHVLVEDRQAAKQRGLELAEEIKAMREEQTSQGKANRAQIIAGVFSIIVALLIVAGSFWAAGGFQ